MLSPEIVRLIKEEVSSYFYEGGLGGHMSHLYENPSMTIGEMKHVFQLATEGKLEDVQEKLDGQNIFFTYDLGNSSLRFARNKSNIKQGGMDAASILEKWKGAPSVRDAFYNAYIVLAKAIEALDPGTIRQIFGDGGNVWYSAEVVYSSTPNVINYDRDALIFHESGMVYDEDGKPLDVDTRGNFAMLNSAIERMQQAVTSSGWSIMGPIVLQLSKATKGNAGDDASSKLDAEVGKYGVNDGNTIGDYIAAKFSLIAKQHLKEITDAQADEFGKIFATVGLSPGQKKKAALGIKKAKDVETLFLGKNQPKILKEIIKPLEAIIHEFAVDVLDGVHSALALHPQREIRRLRDAVEAEIEGIRQAGDEKALEKLGVHLAKLKSVDKITSSLEGIVFKYKGETYKLTGSFAPVNQILGMLRFS
jgi:hypothetical protein